MPRMFSRGTSCWCWSTAEAGPRPSIWFEGILRPPVPFESVPPYLFGGTGSDVGSSGMLGPEWFRRRLEADARQPGAPRPFLPWWDGRQNLAHFGLETHEHGYGFPDAIPCG